jgi:ADP-ribosylglycohydrolase
MNLQDAIYSCLVAGAIGDALGAITESMNYWDIQKKYGWVEDFIEAPDNGYSDIEVGAITDDTTLKYVMCAAIVRKGGRVKPEDLAKIWIEELNLNRVSKTDQISCLKLRAGVSPWEAGSGNIVTCCPSMSITPIGIINAGDLDQAYQDGYNIASISGDGFNLEAAALFCAGIASAFLPGATWETIIETMIRYSRYTMLKCVDLTMNLAQKSSGIEEFRAKYYERFADWWSRPTRCWDRNNYPNGTGAESIPLAMAITYLCKGDLKRSILEAVNFGRDTDTIANFIGSMLGPVSNVCSLKPEWIQRVEDTSKFLYQEFPLLGVSDYTTLATALKECLCNELKALDKRKMVLVEIIG